MRLDANGGNVAVVLAAHGAPPTDYPRFRVGMLMMLEYAPKALRRVCFLRAWHESLVREVTMWPRTADNDPYKAAVDELAAGVSSRLGHRVLAGYNEFCAPTIADAIDQVITDGAERVFVLPTMLLRGNTHTESEIQNAVLEARGRHPEARIEYAWPFEQDRMVSLFAGQVLSHLEAERG
jgi:sirohydrochlorin cobaltochelatase